jgi:hypothetical protein
MYCSLPSSGGRVLPNAQLAQAKKRKMFLINLLSINILRHFLCLFFFKIGYCHELAVSILRFIE